MLPPGLIGDRILTLAAVVLALLYTLVNSVWSSPAEVLQVVVAWCFVPFFWVWRSRPVTSATGFLLCLAAWALTWFLSLPYNTGVSPWLLTAPMAVYTTSRYCDDRRIRVGVLGVTLLGSFASPVMWQLQDDYSLRYSTGTEALFRLIVHWLLLTTVYFAGTRAYGRVLQRRAEENERIARLRSAQEEERLQIARELHDVLAHSLTLMKVQASAGVVASRDDAATAVKALNTIHAIADDALSEVRRIVYALRSNDEFPRGESTDIEGLIEGFRKTGLRISAKVSHDLAQASSLVQLVVARIITESLTNVIRHQGIDSDVELELECNESVDISITSWGSVQAENSGSRTGLIGLEERACSLGGSFSAEGTPDLFYVRAQLPFRSTT